MNLARLHTILDETTVQLRKGPQRTECKAGTVRVVEIFAMPHADEAPSDLEKVDCHFVVVAVDKGKAEEHRAELIELLKTYPQPDVLAGGPSYIAVGAAIGDQGAAFQLFALGQVLGLWELITPTSLGFEGEFADEAAGRGFIMITGWRP
jgi:hypothetical protein